MTTTKLSPKCSCMHIDTLSLNEPLPAIDLIIEPEKASPNVPIKIYKRPTKSDTLSLF